MPWELLSDLSRLPVFALVIARIAGLIMFQPVLSSLAIPTQYRVLLSVALAVLVAPLVPTPAALPDTPLGLALAFGGEVLLGAALGLVTVLLFVGVQLGAMLISQESGLSFAAIFDPTLEEEETTFGVFYLQLASIVFLIAGGHRAILLATLDSFGTLPLLATFDPTRVTLDVLITALAYSGEIGLRIAAPTLLALFLVNIALALLSRTLPQLNLTMLGFSAKVALSFVAMAVSLPAFLSAFLEAGAHAAEGYRGLIRMGGVPYGG